MKMKKVFVFLLAISFLMSCFLIPANATDPDISIVGASIRITGNQGLRFVGKIAKTGVANLTLGESANFGIILFPKSLLDDEEAVITTSTTSVKVVPAVNLLLPSTVSASGIEYSADYYYFSAVLTNIPEEFYGADIVARAYVNNGGSYIYSVQTDRSVQTVAAGIAANPGAPAEQIAFANSVLDIYEERGVDILLQWSSVWNQ